MEAFTDMGKKILKLFLDTMLRAAVIILALAIIVMLVLLAKTMNKTSSTDSSDSTTESTGIVTEEEDPSDLTFGSDEESDSDSSDAADETDSADATEAKIVVINASGVSGVAASWQTSLNSAGYSSVEVGNYLGEIRSGTTVYVSDGYDGQALAANFSSASTGSVSDLDSSLFDVTIGNFDIVIVVGTDNAGNN